MHFIILIRMFLEVFQFGFLLASTFLVSKMWEDEIFISGNFSAMIFLLFLQRVGFLALWDANDSYISLLEFSKFYFQLFIYFPSSVVAWTFYAAHLWIHWLCPHKLLLLLVGLSVNFSNTFQALLEYWNNHSPKTVSMR